MDAEAIAKGLNERERAWILAAHDDVADDAGMIAWRAGCSNGQQFAFFARANPRLLERRRNYADTKFVYMLTGQGRAVRAILKGES